MANVVTIKTDLAGVSNKCTYLISQAMGTKSIINSVYNGDVYSAIYSISRLKSDIISGNAYFIKVYSDINTGLEKLLRRYLFDLHDLYSNTQILSTLTDYQATLYLVQDIKDIFDDYAGIILAGFDYSGTDAIIAISRYIAKLQNIQRLSNFWNSQIIVKGR